MLRTFIVLAPLALVALPARAQAPDDAQIAAIVVAANQVDIDAGRLASARATNPDVKAFAERMITDHAGVNDAAAELVARLGVTPAPNETSRSLEDGGRRNLARLKALEGRAFDDAYIAHEAAYHQQVLEALDSTLIPSASNGELRALLVKVRPAFVAHLEHARALQAKLGGQSR
jgi:putative membrane protein